MEQKNEETCHLLYLPDCLMVTLLSYLDATSLYQLSKTHIRFKDIVADVVLWKYIEARNEPNTNEKVNYCFEKIHEKTNTALFKARSAIMGAIDCYGYLNLNKMNCLKILALENQFIEGNVITMNNFPRSLEEFSLRKTYVKDSALFFKHSCDRLKKLRVLILDDCQWLECGHLMSISKYASLEIISIVSCRMFENDAIAYFGLARLGYRKLKIFDCRFTVLGTTILKTFATNLSLLAYYFQHQRSYTVDYGKRKLKNEPGCLKIWKTQCFPDLTDDVFQQFLQLTGSDAAVTMPDSALYVDPYGECKCQYKEKQKYFKENDWLTKQEFETEHEDICSSCNVATYRVCTDAVSHDTTGRSNFGCPYNCFSFEALGMPRRIAEGVRLRSVVVYDMRNLPPFQSREDFVPVARSPSPDDSEPAAKRQKVEEVKEVERQVDNKEGGTDPPKSPEPTPGPSMRPFNPPSPPKSKQESDEDEGHPPEPEVILGPNADFALPRIVQVYPYQDVPLLARRWDEAINDGIQFIQVGQLREKKIALRRMSLRGYAKITDKTLTHIRHLNLDLLDLTYTKCTVAGIQSFISYNPNCRVVHQCFCTCKPIMPF